MLGVLVRGGLVSAVAIGGAVLCLAGAWIMRRATSSQSRTEIAQAPSGEAQ